MFEIWILRSQGDVLFELWILRSQGDVLIEISVKRASRTQGKLNVETSKKR